MIITSKFVTKYQNNRYKRRNWKNHNAAQWAIDNPNCNFNAVLPRTRQSNDDILHFLTKIKKLLWEIINK